MTTMSISVRPDASPQEIYAAYGLTCPPRVGTLRDPSRKTYGPAVARVAAGLRQPLMPWQRYAADVALEVDPDTHELVYRQVVLLVPRQSGKTTLILSVKTHRALAFRKEVAKHAPGQHPARQRMVYAAQKLKDAQEKFIEDHLPILRKSAYASRMKAREGNGKEGIRWDTGAVESLTANGETSSHGKSLDLAFEDEAFAAEDNRLEAAFSPAMITRWSPQHWVVSTEGTEKSLYLAAKVDAGREIAESGARSSVCYLEWSNLTGDRADPATWWSCMPALGITVTEATIRAELEKLPDDEFDRAYLNRRKRYRPPRDINVPSAAAWAELADPQSVVADPVALAVDVAPRGEHTSICIAGLRGDGQRHVELIDYRPGTQWVVDRLQVLAQRWKPVAIGVDDKGPSGELLQKLLEAGFCRPEEAGKPERGDLAVPTFRELAAACGSLAAAVRERRSDQDGVPQLFDCNVRHRDQAQLNTALESARTRTAGDVWLWARKTSGGDISPLVAATLALWAYEARKDVAEVYNPMANLG
jgi:hypothetical protein